MPKTGTNADGKKEIISEESGNFIWNIGNMLNDDSEFREGNEYEEEELFPGEREKIYATKLQILTLLGTLASAEGNPMQKKAEDCLKQAFTGKKQLTDYGYNDLLVEHVSERFEYDDEEKKLKEKTPDPLKEEPEKAYKIFSQIDWSQFSYEEYKNIRESVIKYVRDVKQGQKVENAQMWTPTDPMEKFFYGFSEQFEHRTKRVDDVTRWKTQKIKHTKTKKDDEWTEIKTYPNEKNQNFRAIRDAMDEFADILCRGTQNLDTEAIREELKKCQENCQEYLASHNSMRLTPKGYNRKKVVGKLNEELKEQLRKLEEAEKEYARQNPKKDREEIKRIIEENAGYLKDYKHYLNPDYEKKWSEFTELLGISGYETYKAAGNVLSKYGIDETMYSRIRELCYDPEWCNDAKNLETLKEKPLENIETIVWTLANGYMNPYITDKGKLHDDQTKIDPEQYKKVFKDLPTMNKLKEDLAKYPDIAAQKEFLNGFLKDEGRKKEFFDNLENNIRFKKISENIKSVEERHDRKGKEAEDILRGSGKDIHNGEGRKRSNSVKVRGKQ